MRRVQSTLNLDLPVADWAKEEGIADEEIRERLQKAADEAYAARVEKNSPEVMRYVEKQIVLQVLDHLWREHLVTLDHLRQVIGWRGYAQRDPLNEYKSEAFELFDGLITRLREVDDGAIDARRGGVRAAAERIAANARLAFRCAERRRRDGHRRNQLAHRCRRFRAAATCSAPCGADPETMVRDPADPSTWGKVGRNEACPCGSGKKFKHCHGAFV